MAPKTVQEIRQQNKLLSPLLVTSERPTNQETVKLDYTRADQTVGKKTLPTTDGSTLEQTLYVITEFQEAATQSGWDAALRFTRFREVLTGNARTEWDTALAAQPANRNLAVFQDTVREMIKVKTGHGSFQSFVEYLSMLKKPNSMAPGEFISRLQTLFRYSEKLCNEDGSAPVPLSDLQKRRYILRAFPDPWITNFQNAGKNVATTTIAEIQQYMTQQAAHEVHTFGGNNKKRGNEFNDTGGFNRRIRGGGGRGGNRNGGHNNNNSQRGGTFSGRGNGGRFGRGGRGRGGRGGNEFPRKPKVQPDDVCPIHGGHKWRRCMFNPHRDADAPSYEQKNGKFNNNKGQVPSGSFMITPVPGGSQAVVPGTGNSTPPTCFFVGQTPGSGASTVSTASPPLYHFTPHSN